MTASAKLAALGVRIERIAVRPEEIKSRIVRLAKPLLKRWATDPQLSIAAARELVAEPTEKQLDAALRELSRNVTAVERMILIQGTVPTAHAAWLRRLWEVVGRAANALDDDLLSRSLEHVDRAMILPPLTAPDPALVALQLSSIDHLLEAAREERDVLAHRRRMLEAARQLLLDVSAAMELDARGVGERLASIGDQIAWIDRLQAAGVRTDVGLVHQARSAFARNERDRLYAVLSAIDRFAVIQNDVDVMRRTERALHGMRNGPDGQCDAAESQLRSAREVFSQPVIDAIQRGYETARNRHERGVLVEQLWTETLANYLAPGAEHATISSALAVDGCFEVGGGLSPVRVTEEVKRVHVVDHPAKEMALVSARGPEDLPYAVLDDPRALILQLASGRLLARRYVEEKIEQRHRVVRTGEVRFYLLDGSTSMIGPRARMRDSILVAELATIARRLATRKVDTRVVLYYRYFSDILSALQKVDTAQAAVEHIETVLSSMPTGGTDIERALTSCLRQIGNAKDEDPTLARAQIVLVTDGEAELSAARVEEERARLGELHVAISVIAIGNENQALRRIVAAQRKNGERAFYHFVDDERVNAIVSGKTSMPSIHVPPISGSNALEAELEDTIEELAMLKRERDLGELASAGDRAKREAATGDRSGLTRRFLRWFPDPAKLESDRAPPPAEGTVEKSDLETMLVLFSTITEVLRLIEGSEDMRRADAVDLVERLLPDARLSPGRWDFILSRWPGKMHDALHAVHAAAKRGAFAPR